MGARDGHCGGARLCADVPRVREARSLSTRTRPARGDDGVLFGWTLYLLSGAVLQARHCDSGAYGYVLRQTGGIYGRCALGGYF